MNINSISNMTIFRVLTVVTIFLVSLIILFQLSAVIIWTISAFILTIFMTPVVEYFKRFMPKKSRGLSIAAVYLTVIAIFLILSLSIFPIIYNQCVQFFNSIPDLYTKFMSSNSQVATAIKSNASLQNLSNNLFSQENIKNIVNILFKFTVSFFSGIASVFTILTISAYMTFEGPNLLKLFWRVQDKDKTPKRREVVGKTYNAVFYYVLAQALTSSIAGISAYVVMLLMGLPTSVFMIILVAFLDLIPVFGVLIYGAILIGTALVFGGTTQAIIMLLFVIAYTNFENGFLSPYVYSKAIKISPLTVIMACIIGGALAGIIGVIISIPIAASIQIYLLEYYGDKMIEPVASK